MPAGPNVTDPLEPPVTSTWSPRPVTQAGPAGQNAEPAAALRLSAVAFSVGACGLSDVTAELEFGEVAALTGPVGSGKSTLLRVIGGVQNILSGDIWLNDQNASVSAPDQRDISWVPQGGGLFPALPVWRQIGFPLQVRGVSDAEVRDHVEEIARKWEISELLDRRPAKLSGGERQLVALARATIRRPTGLMLDEPYSALSDERRRFAIERLREWRSNGSPLWVIHASHRVEEIIDATVNWRIGDGRLHTASVAR